MSLLHKLIMQTKRFKKYPRVRRTVWIDKTALVPEDATIGERVKIKGKVTIGIDFFCNDDVQLWGDDTNGIVIGNHVRIYTKVMVDSGNHDENDPDYKFTTGKKITIKDYAVLDNSACVCKGVTIGFAAIVSTGAVVLFDVPDYAVIAGNPAEVIGYRQHREERTTKEIVRDLKEREDLAMAIIGPGKGENP